MIRIENLTFRYPISTQASLTGIDLSVQPGECVLLTGKSGCGKTTLTRVLNGLCPKFYGGALEGSYLLNGENAAALSLDVIGSRLGSVFQDPRSQFFAKRVRDEIVLALENHCFERAVMQERLAEVCEQLGIAYLLDRTMAPLSSGEKQKVALASVCALQPEGLVLDEPSANLDATATQQLARFLSNLKQQGHTLVVSEHRLHYLKDIFDRLIILDEGAITHEFTREEALALSEDRLDELGLRKFELPHIDTVGRVKTYDGCRLTAEELAFSVSDRQIFQGITLGARPGEVMAITGSNGAGKTSLCRILSGIQKETAGIVKLDGVPAGKKARIRDSFFVQQDIDYQLYTPRVATEIVLGTAQAPEEAPLLPIVKALSLDAVLDRHPNTLSGGQKQRVLLAASSLRASATVILDEPTSGLDGYHMHQTAELIKDLAQSGRGILLITHDLELIAEAATSLLHLGDGGVRYHTCLQ